MFLICVLKWRAHDVSPCDDECTRHVAHSVYMCVHVCTRVCMSVISGLKHPLRIFANPLDVYTIYTCRISLIFDTWDYFSLFLFSSDVAQSRADDRTI